MAITAYFIKQSKRRNSTLQFALTGASEFACTLKAPTSLDRPTFLLSYSTTFDFNLAFFDGKFYFVDNVVSVRDGQWEVSCVVDVLATYKTEILASSQFVTYSASETINDWLADERLPVSLEANTALGAVDPQTDYDPFDATGFYALTVNGKNGCTTYGLSYTDIQSLLNALDNWYYGGVVHDILLGSKAGVSYQWTTTEQCLKSLSEILSQSSVVGNAYSNAPQCILSCIWVPLDMTPYQDTNKEIYLGEYATGVHAWSIKADALFGQWLVNIPWYSSDWRRVKNSTVALYLPFCGQVNLPVDLIAKEDKLLIGASISAVDGVINYYIEGYSDLNLVGTYKTCCASSYAIGINQRSSLSEVVQTQISGAERMVNSVINSSLNPASIVAGGIGAVMEGLITSWQTDNIKLSTHPTTIGSMGGSGMNFWTSPVCYVTNNPLACSQADVKSTIGVPVMEVKSLSTLSGYTQCLNAHIEAPAQAEELNALDTFLNTGFYIE